MNLLNYKGLFPRPVHPSASRPFGAESFEPFTPGPGTMYPFALTKAEAIWAFWRVRHWAITASLASGSTADEGLSVTWESGTATAHTGDINNVSRAHSPAGRRPIDLLNSTPPPEILHSTRLEFSGTAAVTETFLGEDPGDPISSTGTITGDIRLTPRSIEPPEFLWLVTYGDPVRYYPRINLQISAGVGTVGISDISIESVDAGGDELGTWSWQLPTRTLTVPLYGFSNVFAGGTLAFSSITLSAHEEWEYGGV